MGGTICAPLMGGTICDLQAICGWHHLQQSSIWCHPPYGIHLVPPTLRHPFGATHLTIHLVPPTLPSIWCHPPYGPQLTGPPYGPTHLLKYSDVPRITQVVASKPHGPVKPPRPSSNVTGTIDSGFFGNLASLIAGFTELLAQSSPKSPSSPAPRTPRMAKQMGGTLFPTLFPSMSGARWL